MKPSTIFRLKQTLKSGGNINFFLFVSVLIVIARAIPEARIDFLQNGTNVDYHEWEGHRDDNLHLGADGVLRSLDENGLVLNYAQLSPGRISQFNAATAYKYYADWANYLESANEGVDGRTITDLEQLTEPGPYLLPPVMPVDTAMKLGPGERRRCGYRIANSENVPLHNKQSQYLSNIS
ncbi:hypothetical protein MMC12_006160 [Toensbergia leucococca]|nr:hypothetical protein [Toensbergia leucococca]